MRWRKRDLWKAGIVIAGMLLLLVLTVWVPVSAAGAHEVTSGLAGSGTVTVQATPTVDATVTALNKEKLTQEVAQQRTWQNWLWSNAATVLSSFLSTLVLVIGALIGFWQWRLGRADAQDKESKGRQAAQGKELEDRKAEREKRAEERFQAVVAGFGSKNVEAKVGAAIMLRTFLHPGYEQFYSQAFDLAVAQLRLRKVDPDRSEPLDSLSQALIIVLKESFPTLLSPAQIRQE